MLVSVMLCACSTKRTKISVERGSTADSLVFHVSGSPGSRPVSLGILRVDECAQLLGSGGTFPEAHRAAWMMEAIVGEAPPVSSIVYGHPPRGYHDLQPARPLRLPGCYAATISGTGVVGFEVSPTGSIREMSEAERERRTVPR